MICTASRDKGEVSGGSRKIIEGSRTVSENHKMLRVQQLEPLFFLPEKDMPDDESQRE